jgi:GTP cyclohydrolase I
MYIKTPLPTPTILDIQSSKDARNIALNKVGIKQLLHPAIIEDTPLPLQHTLAKFSMFVGLSASVRGTHMSRFIEILNETETTLGVSHTPILLAQILSRLQADSAYYEAKFPFFISKSAPISGAKSLMDYQVTLSGKVETGKLINQITIIVPVTSLCPCSKQISDYGAHNQRSEITVKAVTNGKISIHALIQLVESQASCDLFGILKRSDEKWVTERAYDNPKFVEDVVRDIAVQLEKLDSVLAYEIASENFESIHNHSAYALIRSGEII